MPLAGWAVVFSSPSSETSSETHREVGLGAARRGGVRPGLGPAGEGVFLSGQPSGPGDPSLAALGRDLHAA